MQRIVVVGASLAGLRSAEALRRGGFAGELLLIGDESHAPYDRPPLSKEILRDEWARERLALRRDPAVEGLSFRLGARATGLDLARRELLLDKERVGFDALVIATGARVRRLVNARGLTGISALRTLEDALYVRDALKQRPRLVVIGAGFIGLEVAATARSLGLDVTVVEAARSPLSRQLGEAMGAVVAKLHTSRGVELITGTSVAGFVGEGAVQAVQLSDGRSIAADLVVEGIGVMPNVEWLADSGIDLGDGVMCDEAMRVLDRSGAVIEGVVAVGDVANFVNPLYGERMRIEHWTHAVEQADSAARTLLGRPEPFETAPLFWSDQYGIKIQFAGRAHPDDDVVVMQGSEERFVALYGRAGRLVGVLTFQRPAQLAKYRALIRSRTAFSEATAKAP